MCASGQTKFGTLRGASYLYVTIIGVFLTAGIFLDLMCRCDEDNLHDCCRSNYRGLSLGAAPFPIAFVWCLANKLAFEFFLGKERTKKKRAGKRSVRGRKRKAVTESCNFGLSSIICVVAMAVIGVAGLVATSVYSFKFHVRFRATPRIA